MLKSLVLDFGPTPGAPPLTVPAGSAIVLVGPNNSGKSQFLKELQFFLEKGRPRRSTLGRILRDIECELPRNERLLDELVGTIMKELPKHAFEKPGVPFELDSLLKGLDAEDLSTTTRLVKDGILVLGPQSQRLEAILDDAFNVFKAYFAAVDVLKNHQKLMAILSETDQSKLPELERVVLDLSLAGVKMLTDLNKIARERGRKAAIIEVIQDGRIRVSPYVSLLGPRTLRLDGQQRLEHVRPAPLPSAGQDHPLIRLLRSPEALQVLRQRVHEAFGEYLAIDVTSFSKTTLRMSSQAPGEHELSPLKPEAIEYFSQTRPIEDYSDGVKSFVGLLSAVMSSEYLVMLIDEPEAFLYPPLARRLGQNLHQLARERNAHIVAATHSADFLMGCIQASLDVNIVRLTYRRGVPTARLLPVIELKKMMLDPLLRSTGTLGALFHEGAVVCEGDSDRAFYQEINERLVRRKQGVEDCLFMNAHNKQSIRRIVETLRKMGVPAAAIVDLDLLLDENVLKDLLLVAGAEPASINALGAIKGEFRQCFFPDGVDRETCKARLKEQGIKALSEKQQAAMKQLFFNPLAELGIFVVPVGELESWLQSLHPGGRPAKQGWLHATFEALGSNPSERYVHPTNGDVWDFVEAIGSWISNPSRGGMSA
jgi:energy-coupling factor transporter ATP-binding protein EcfA2